MTDEKFNWEKIDWIVSRSRERMSRARAPNGWLVKYVYRGGPDRSAHAMVYVPDAEGAWEISEKSPKWEKVQFKRTPNDDVKTLRWKVPGGWLVRDGYYVEGHLSMAMEFAPDPSHSWEI